MPSKSPSIEQLHIVRPQSTSEEEYKKSRKHLHEKLRKQYGRIEIMVNKNKGPQVQLQKSLFGQ